MAKGNVTVYISVADVERLTERGLEPKEFARAAVKQALEELDQHQAEALADTLRPSPFLHLPPLTDEQNQMLEESAEGQQESYAVFDESFSTPLETIGPEGDDWLARLRARANAE